MRLSLTITGCFFLLFTFTLFAGNAGEADAEGATAEKRVTTAEYESSKGQVKEMRFRISVANAFSHNTDRDNPSLQDFLTLSLAAELPIKLTAGLSYGIMQYYNYGRGEQVDAQSVDGGGSGKSADSGDWDMVPLSLFLSRSFQIPWKIRVTPSFSAGFPATTRYNLAEIDAVFSGKVSFSRSFKPAKKSVISLSLVPAYKYTIAEYDSIHLPNSGAVFWGFNEHVLGNSTVVSFSWRGFSTSVGVSHSYRIKNSSSRSEEKFYGEQNVKKNDSYQLNMHYFASLGYALYDFFFSVEASSGGPFRKYGGYGDIVYPGEAGYTTITANAGYTLNF